MPPQSSPLWLGSYRILDKLGVGSFSSVYLASNTVRRPSDDGKPLTKSAIKLVRMDEVTHVEILRKEAEVLKDLRVLASDEHKDSEHIVQLVEMIETDDWIGMVLEYVDGTDLYHYIMDNAGDHVGLAEKDAKKIFVQLVRATRFIHKRNYAHCDIKLDNVLLTFSNQLKLIDFGLALPCHPINNSGHSTRRRGSIPYQSAESFSAGRYDPKGADKWALGVVLFAMLTARMPFDKEPNALRAGRERGTIEGRSAMIERIKACKWEWSAIEKTNISVEARNLVEVILTKNSLSRPSVEDILQHPWLKETEDDSQGKSNLTISTSGDLGNTADKWFDDVFEALSTVGCCSPNRRDMSLG